MKPNYLDNIRLLLSVPLSNMITDSMVLHTVLVRQMGLEYDIRDLPLLKYLPCICHLPFISIGSRV